MRVVIDTNVLISSILYKHSIPRKIFNLQQSQRYKLVASESILQEYQRVLSYPHIQHLHKKTPIQIEQFIIRFRSVVDVVYPTEEVTIITDDLSDNIFLSCALAGKAEYIISGDHHLLNIRTYKGIYILTPAAFLTFITKES